MSRDEKPELRVPGWFVAAFFFVAGSSAAAMKILPPETTARDVAEILNAGILAAGASVAMLSSGRKK